MAKFAVEIKLAKLAVEIKLAKLAVETRLPPVIFAKAIPLIDDKKTCCDELLVELMIPVLICRLLRVVAITSPILINPLFEPIVNEFVVSELINAVVPCIFIVESDETASVANVLPSCVDRYVVEIKLAKFAVEI